MTLPANPDDRGYEDLFSDFDSPLMRQLRREAYGKDIGQHSRVSAEELEQYVPQLALTSQGPPPRSRLWPLRAAGVHRWLAWLPDGQISVRQRLRLYSLRSDVAVITGSVSDEEVRLRAVHGYTQFVPVGFNERLLKDSGFRLLERTDRTESLINNARGG